MIEVQLPPLLETLDEFSDEFHPNTRDSHELPQLVPLVRDFLDDVTVEGTPDVIDLLQERLAALSADSRKILVIMLGLLNSPAFRATLVKHLPGDFLEAYLLGKLAELVSVLAEYVDPPLFLDDADRREELCRKVVHALDWAIAGESEEDSEARLLQLDSVEIYRIQQEVEKKIQKALEEARRRAAAAKVSRE